MGCNFVEQVKFLSQSVLDHFAFVPSWNQGKLLLLTIELDTNKPNRI